MVAPKPNTTAQRTPRGVTRAPPEARDVPEPTPMQVSQQLAAISWQRGERSRGITLPVQPRVRGNGTVRCVKSSGRKLRFTYRLAETFRLSSIVEGLACQVPGRRESRTATWSAVRSHTDRLSWAWETHTELSQEEYGSCSQHQCTHVSKNKHVVSSVTPRLHVWHEIFHKIHHIINFCPA